MIGRTISHYRILRRLGEGGMGVVYEAEDTKLERIVALKFLPRELTLLEDSKERFVREARAASRLDHPNVCTVHEIDETQDGQLFICMARCGGESLAARLQRGAMPLAEAIVVGLQIGRGLAQAHEQGIVHRDIKPANIMITERNEVKILDFGIAKQLGHPRLTQTGRAVGTPAYMSPEQAESQPVDHRTDIWSLGVVLHELVSGRLPFQADTSGALLNKICNQKPLRLAQTQEGMAEYQAIIDRCLEKDPDRRYQHLPDLLAELGELLKELQATGTTAGMGRFRRGRGLRRVEEFGLLAVVVVFMGAALLIWRQEKEADASRQRLSDVPFTPPCRGQRPPDAPARGLTSSALQWSRAIRAPC